MTLALELGQVTDPTARRALEQISLRWPPTGAVALFIGRGVPTPATGVIGALYLDLTGKRFYGPKAASGWPVIGTLT